MHDSDNLSLRTVKFLSEIEKFTGRDDFVNKIINIIDKLTAKGWFPVVASGLRTRAEQAKKVQDGVSKTMESKHLIGKAVDIVDKRYFWGVPNAAHNTNVKNEIRHAARLDFCFWQDLGAAVREEKGLIWGGLWEHFKDVAHVEEI